MRFLGLIPARGGSQRLPGKNLIDLGGKPLLAWTIQAAKASCALDSIVVSTDSQKIATVAQQSGARALIRPIERAMGEDGSMVRTVAHALIYYASFDYVVLLQPTSPFRTGDDIRRAIGWLGQHDSLVSVGPNGVPNGAIYIIKTSLIARGRAIYGVDSRRYEMPSARSIDIDTQADLDIARAALSHRMAHARP